jgi:hypothetical protein
MRSFIICTPRRIFLDVQIKWHSLCSIQIILIYWGIHKYFKDKHEIRFKGSVTTNAAVPIR